MRTPGSAGGDQNGPVIGTMVPYVGTLGVTLSAFTDVMTPAVPGVVALSNTRPHPPRRESVDWRIDIVPGPLLTTRGCAVSDAVANSPPVTATTTRTRMATVRRLRREKAP